MFKHLIRFLLFITASTLLYELARANYLHSKTENYSDCLTALDHHLTTTIETINYSIHTLIVGNWTGFSLVRWGIILFNHKIYWIVLVLFLLICYFKIRGDQVSNENEYVNLNEKKDSKTYK